MVLGRCTIPMAAIVAIVLSLSTRFHIQPVAALPAPISEWHNDHVTACHAVRQ